MSSSKSIILTGASRGIGLAIAHYLLRESHKVFMVARSGEPLEKLKVQYPGQVEYVAADITDFSVRGLLIVDSLFFAAARRCVLLPAQSWVRVCGDRANLL
jgi:NAD(P)-dependent dehydrogenase (short-subunit alcohol dehydrogenase family)